MNLKSNWQDYCILTILYPGHFQQKAGFQVMASLQDFGMYISVEYVFE